VVAQLSRHLSAEEQYLYPAVRQVVPEGAALADRELAEDHALLLALRDLDRSVSSRSPSTPPAAPSPPPVPPSPPAAAPSPSASAAARVVEAVRRHVEADAAELLPRLAREVPVEDLIRVGNRVETAGEAAPTRPHPGTPSRPPWNKIVDPVVALADKTRDALSRRPTYPEDLDPR
jgi:hypothetical protein